MIPATAAQLRSRFGLVIIDSPPSVHATIRTVAAACDLALIPARPTVDDLDAIGPIARLLQGVVDFGFVQTQVPGKRSVDGAEALERLAVRAPVLGRTTFRSAYSRPPANGGTGFETDPAPQEEIGELYRRLKDRFDAGSSPDHAITRAGAA
jgi:chromosome partitioning protein